MNNGYQDDAPDEEHGYEDDYQDDYHIPEQDHDEYSEDHGAAKQESFYDEDT